MSAIHQLFNQSSPKTQGYLCVLFTMLIWGGFSLMSRVSVHWQVAIWDILAMRFGFSCLLLLPVLYYKKQWRFLFNWRIFIIAILGGIGYSSLVYTAFSLAPVVHGAVFLNGMIPVATALLLWIFLRIKPDFDTKLALIIIIMTLVAMMSVIASGAYHFNVGDALFIGCALAWSAFGILLKEWRFTPWQTMCGTVVWSSAVYLPIYGLFIGFSSPNASVHHLAMQGIFHSVLVMIVATLTYAVAVARLGAFTAGGLSSLAPFISALVAVPLLGESLNSVMVLGLIGMGLGTVQPWRWLKRS